MGDQNLWPEHNLKPKLRRHSQCSPGGSCVWWSSRSGLAVPRLHERWHTSPLTQWPPPAVLCVCVRWGPPLNCADKEDFHSLHTSHRSADCPGGPFPSPSNQLTTSLTDSLQVVGLLGTRPRGQFVRALGIQQKRACHPVRQKRANWRKRRHWCYLSGSVSGRVISETTGTEGIPWFHSPFLNIWKKRVLFVFFCLSSTKQ